VGSTTYTQSCGVIVAERFEDGPPRPRLRPPLIGVALRRPGPLVIPRFPRRQRPRVVTDTDLTNRSANRGAGPAIRARQISSPPGSINPIALGIMELCSLISVTTLARIDFAAVRLDASNRLLLKTTRSLGDAPVARNSYFQTLPDLTGDNLTS
jgi:hypothetical protein